MGITEGKRVRTVRAGALVAVLALLVGLHYGANAAPGNGKGPGKDKQTTTTTEPVAEVADIAVSLADSADPIQLGEQLTYTVTVDNVGTAPAEDVDAMLWIRHADTRGTFLFDEIVTSQGECNEPTVSDVNYVFSERTERVECSVGSIAPGGRVTIEVTGTPTFVARGSDRYRSPLSAYADAYRAPSAADPEPDYANNRSPYEFTDVTSGDDTNDCLLFRAGVVSTYNPAYAAECLDQ